MSFFGNFFKKVFGSSGSSNAGRTTQPRTYFKGYTPNTPKYTSSSVGNGQYSYRTTSAQGEKSGESKKETPKVYTSKEEEYKRKRIADSYEQERNRQKLKKAKADGAYEKITGDDKRTNAQKKLAQKMLLNDRMEAENKYSAKYQPHLHAMSKGAVRGATLGASDLLEKKASKGYKKIEADYKKNQTDTDKFIEGATELATTGLMFGASKGISEKALSKAVKVGDKATKGLVTKGGKAVEKKLVKKFGETEGKKLAKSLAEDFAIDSTTGNIMAAINASQEEGDLKDKAKAFAKESALNSILSTGITVAPTVIKNNKALREAIPKAKGKFNASEMPKLKDEALHLERISKTQMLKMLRAN